jgi:hypothetical protein
MIYKHQLLFKTLSFTAHPKDVSQYDRKTTQSFSNRGSSLAGKTKYVG